MIAGAAGSALRFWRLFLAVSSDDRAFIGSGGACRENISDVLLAVTKLRFQNINLVKRVIYPLMMFYI